MKGRAALRLSIDEQIYLTSNYYIDSLAGLNVFPETVHFLSIATSKTLQSQTV